MIAAGLVILSTTIVSLAKKHLTEAFCIVWGIVAAMFICAGIILRPTQWKIYISWSGLLLVLSGAALVLAGVFFFSVRISMLTRQVKELAIQVSLLNQEHEMIRREFFEDTAESEMMGREEASVRH